MNRFKNVMANTAVLCFLAVFSTEAASAYVTYLTGRMTLPGCAVNYGNTCVIKVDMPGPPEEGAEITGTADINTATTTQISSHVFVSSPANPQAFYSQGCTTILSIWHTDDNSPCPIPNP